MDKKDTKNEDKSFLFRITPLELERMLRKYGIHIKYYTENLRNKSQGWWYSVLRRKQYLNYVDIKALMDDVGEETFIKLLDEVRCKKTDTNIENE